MDEVFKTNPGAISGSSRGQCAGRLSSMNSSAQRLSSMSTFLSVDNTAVLCTPFTMSTWESQLSSVQEATAISDWNSLLDSNCTIKEDGLGSGQLHRAGKNYKPLPEADILNQRLGKGIPVINAVTGEGIKKKKKKKRAKIISMPVHVLPLSTVNGWGSGQLTSTPFWEQQQQTIEDPTYMFENMPLLKLEVELAPGVTIPLTILKGDRMDSLVDDFCNHHHLTMTQESKEALASTLDLLIQTKYP